jgi:hypothetical protein
MKSLSKFSRMLTLIALFVLGAYATQAQERIELLRAGGAYIDLKNSAGEDFDIRLWQRANNELGVYGGNLVVDGFSLATTKDLHFRKSGSAGTEWLFHHPTNSDILYVGHGTNGWQWDYRFMKTQFYAKKISIGTLTMPSGYKLSVDGKGLFEEIHLQNSTRWPDYVFANNYKLRSLKDTEAFIAKNKHLPEVPSAKEVKQNGYDMGEMTKILLKKIEELTLHTIAQQKEIEALKAKVQK